MSTAWYWPDWGACSDPPAESCSDAGCPVHGELPAPGDQAGSIAAQAAIGSRCTSCNQKRVNCRCAS